MRCHRAPRSERRRNGALDWSRLGTTQLGWVPSILLVAAGGLYLWGAWRIERIEGTPWSPRRTAAFLGGLLVTFVAIEGWSAPMTTRCSTIT